MERSDFRPWTLDIPCWILDIQFQRTITFIYEPIGSVYWKLLHDYQVRAGNIPVRRERISREMGKNHSNGG